MTEKLSDRVILHCDLNNFFASVETYFDPSLKEFPVAVCGSRENRHGIVLAKNDKAKARGVKTAEAIWQAKQKCPELMCIPPHYKWYAAFSKRVKEIYYDYTDLVEPFGIDECWLDVTGSGLLFGTGEEIAEILRNRVKREMGLTISVGVSFNKIFAKLGSDMKKPDAVTVISHENFREKVWPLPADSIIGAGKSTIKVLDKLGLHTLGDVAKCPPELMESQLGKSGISLWRHANGFSNSPVICESDFPAAKSYSHGTTPSHNLKNEDEIKSTLIHLAETLSKQLRRDKVLASTVSLNVRDENLVRTERRKKLINPTRLVDPLVDAAMELYRKNFSHIPELRSVTIGASDLINDNEYTQMSLFADTHKEEKMEKLEAQIESIRNKYGNSAIIRGVKKSNT